MQLFEDKSSNSDTNGNDMNVHIETFDRVYVYP